jgi:hypothetical protein
MLRYILYDWHLSLSTSVCLTTCQLIPTKTYTNLLKDLPALFDATNPFFDLFPRQMWHKCVVA